MLPVGNIGDEPLLRLLSPDGVKAVCVQILWPAGCTGKQKKALNSGLTLRRMPFNQRACRSKRPYHCTNRLNLPFCLDPARTMHGWVPPAWQVKRGSSFNKLYPEKIRHDESTPAACYWVGNIDCNCITVCTPNLIFPL